MGIFIMKNLLMIFWKYNEEKDNYTKDKIKENNKIIVEDFYNLISITKNNNYNIISLNN